jgi:hypothetical protein
VDGLGRFDAYTQGGLCVFPVSRTLFTLGKRELFRDIGGGCRLQIILPWEPS